MIFVQQLLKSKCIRVKPVIGDLVRTENRHEKVAKIDSIDLSTGPACPFSRDGQNSLVIGFFAKAAGKG